jgi:tRNA G37 N-methylase TrmD
MRIMVLTIFPEMFDGLWTHGMVRRAIEQQALSAQALNIGILPATSTMSPTTGLTAAAAAW